MHLSILPNFTLIILDISTIKSSAPESVTFSFAFRDSLIFPGIATKSDPIYNAFSSCLEQTSNQAITIVLAQGGTYKENNLDTFQVYKLARPSLSGDKTLKTRYEFSKESIENSIGVFFNEVFESCLYGVDFDKFNGTSFAGGGENKSASAIEVSGGVAYTIAQNVTARVDGGIMTPHNITKDDDKAKSLTTRIDMSF